MEIFNPSWNFNLVYRIEKIAVIWKVSPWVENISTRAEIKYPRVNRKFNKSKKTKMKTRQNKSDQRRLQSAKFEMSNSSIIQCYITIITSSACSHWKLPLFKNENVTYDRCVLYISWYSMKLLNSCKHFMR